MRLGDYIEELCEKTNINNQYEVLTSSQNGIVSQKDYFNKQVASENNIGYKIIKKGEFTYRSMSDTGLFYINQLINYEIGIVSPAYPVFRISNNNLDPEFLQFYFQSSKFQHQICNQSTGSTRLALKFRKLASLDISIPSLIKQKKIICNLKTFKNAIKIEEKQLFLLDELIKSRFVEMFMIDEKDKYPLKKWKDVAIIKHGKDYKKNIASDGGYPVYGSGGFMGVYADKNLANENSIIIGRKGTIDKPILVKEKIWNVDTAFAVEVKKEFLNPIFFYVRSTLYDLKSMSTSTTLPSMTQSTLHNIEIGIPPIKLQNEFANFVKQIDKLKFVVHSRYFLCEILTLFSSTIAYSRVVSILACPNIF